MPETQTKGQPPKGPPPTIATGFPDDPIEELGEQIAALPKSAAKNLTRFVTEKICSTTSQANP